MQLVSVMVSSIQVGTIVSAVWISETKSSSCESWANHGASAFQAAVKLRIEVSLAPEDVRMQQAMDFCFFSPAELQQAHFVCTSMSCKGLADA